jgi:hypothetical protein
MPCNVYELYHENNYPEWPQRQCYVSVHLASDFICGRSGQTLAVERLNKTQKIYTY